MRRTAVINIVGLTRKLISENTPNIAAYAKENWQSSIKPSFPALTCTAQSDYLTGTSPAQHGIVGNGWYNRSYSEVHFWKQSNHLVEAPKLWDALKSANPGFTCAKLFWWYNMYSTVDYSITPRPMYPADGRKVFDIYTEPVPIRDDIKKDLGEFPFHSFWGPKAGIESSRWIASSAKWIEEKYQPTLNLIYLPHLDYNLQRLGPSHPDIADDLKAIDTVVGDLITFFNKHSVQIILLSEYGITDVNRPIHLNRLFREEGWISIKDELGLEHLDCGASKVFAVADHQVAHVYVNDSSLLDSVKSLLKSVDGVDTVLDEPGKATAHINHARSGDLIAIADEQSWFTYYYWLDDAVAPDFARCVDIHRKPGYDPVELFINPDISLPTAKVAKFLLKKKLGFRALLDVIPLDANLVKGSHGRMPDNPTNCPVFIGPIPSDPTAIDERIHSTDVYSLLKNYIG